MIGTAAGVVLGVAFAMNIDTVMATLNALSGAEVWDPSIRGIYALPAEVKLADVLSAVALSLGFRSSSPSFPRGGRRG